MTNRVRDTIASGAGGGTKEELTLAFLNLPYFLVASRSSRLQHLVGYQRGYAERTKRYIKSIAISRFPASYSINFRFKV